MLVAEKVDELRAKINYDKDKDIQDTLELPNDFYRAIEYALRTMCKKAKITLKSVLVPFVADSKYFNVPLANSGVSEFEIVSPKNFHILLYDGSIIELTQDETENILSNTYDLNLLMYRITLRKFVDTIKIQANIEVNSQPAAGTYDTIIGISGADVTTNFGSVIGYYCINLSKADENIYSYRRVTGVAGAVNTMDSSVSAIWSNGDKLYFVNGLPYLIAMYFQGLPKSRYFDTSTNTTIPIDDVYLDYIDTFAMEYLYELTKARFPEHTQLWLTQVGKNKTEIADIRKLANQRSAYTIVKKYTPYPHDYGR